MHECKNQPDVSLTMGANASACSKSRFSPISHSRNANAPSTNNLPVILFHNAHGENIRLSRDQAVARRSESFCKGLAFSNRPVHVNEKIYIKFVETSTSWSGALRFGFTANDPNTQLPGLPRYACPDLTNKPGNWAKALGERYAVRDTVLFFYVTETGDVYFGINGVEKGIFFGGVNTSTQLWALLDIYGNTIGIELMDCRQQLNNNRRPQNPTEMERYIQPLASLRIGNAEPEIQLQTYRGVTFTSMPFHRSRGLNVQISADGCVAERALDEYCKGYVFTSTPLRTGAKLVVQVLRVDQSFHGSLVFGLTTCNPATLNTTDLPEDADNLIDRPEYWVVKKDVASNPQQFDELTFTITETGEVQCAKNSQPLSTVMYVDHTQQFWAFFDLYGNTIKLRILGIPCETGPSPNPSSAVFPTNSFSEALRDAPRFTSESSLVVDLPPVGNNEAVVAPVIEGIDTVVSECVICCEKSIDCVIYQCGHMCMCYECAVHQWRGTNSGGLCPICRAIIRDVIKTYKS